MHDESKSQPWWRRWITRLERALKVSLFDCSMCGQCILRSTGLVCPMRCPKQMRNGPCGGSTDGKCEVYPDRPCVWKLAYDRARQLGLEHKLEEIQPAPDWSLWGTSAVLNLLEGKIDASGHARPPAPARELRVVENPAPAAASCGTGCCCIQATHRRAGKLRTPTEGCLTPPCTDQPA